MSKTTFGFIPVTSSGLPKPLEEIGSELWQQLYHIGGEQFTGDRNCESLPTVFLILTGGSEQSVLELHSQRKKHYANEPVVLLAHPAHNSLPAAMDDLEKTIKHLTVYHQLKKIKIGLIGEPSAWLVASSPEIETIKNVWGPEVVKISLKELEDTIAEIKDEDVENEHFTFSKNAGEVKEPTKKEVKQAVRVYGAVKRIVQKYELNAVSIRCFDLVLDIKTTGCFALSKLNDDGIVAGCEGDLVSTLGMLWANAMTDQTVWMANPAQLDEQNNSIWFAHCTVPISMIQTYKLRSHFESGLSVAIQGEFTKGKVTLLRLGGSNLDKIWITSGEILESGSAENLCRTQVNVKLHGAAKPSDLLNAPLGNHVLMLRGTYTKEMLNWWETFIGNDNM